MDNKKVIIVTPGGSFFTDPYMRAFEKFGYNCIAFDSRNGFIYSSFFRKLSRHISPLRFFKKIKVNSINKKLISLVKQEKPQYMFVQKGETIRPATLDLIRGLGTVTINFYNDFEWPVISKIAPHYDYFFTQHHLILEKLWREFNLKNSFHMNHAAEPSADPFTDRQNKYNISFIGTYNKKVYPNRERYLMAVKDLRLSIWGSSGWINTPLKNNFQGRSKDYERFDIYKKSKISIDINWEHFNSDGVSVRPFEIAASGACLFADLTKKDIKDAYEENTEFISFSNAQELHEKARYYLEHDDEREKIARAGYNRTVAQHTYINRMDQLFDTMEHPDKYLYKLR